MHIYLIGISERRNSDILNLNDRLLFYLSKSRQQVYQTHLHIFNNCKNMSKKKKKKYKNQRSKWRVSAIRAPKTRRFLKNCSEDSKTPCTRYNLWFRYFHTEHSSVSLLPTHRHFLRWRNTHGSRRIIMSSVGFACTIAAQVGNNAQTVGLLT